MLKTRLITAAFFCSLVIYIISFSPEHLFLLYFSIMVSISIFLSGTEYAAMRWNIMEKPSYTEQPKPKLEFKYFLIGFTYGFSDFLFYLLKEYFGEINEKALVLMICWIFLCTSVAAVFVYRKATDMHTASNKLLNVIAGYVYLALPSICVIKLGMIHVDGAVRGAPLYFCLGTTLMGDTGAFFVGTLLGKHKFIRRISPKKSLEGAIGGLVMSALTALLISHFFRIPFPVWLCIIGGICIGVGGQVGDIIESAFKRAGGYKDSGNLLPGHGGFLDRIDSLVLGIPATYILFALYF